MPNSLALRSAFTLISMLFCCQHILAGNGALNDTGITFCGYDNGITENCALEGADSGAYPRQDARYGRDALAAAGKLNKTGGGSKGFDYTKIANDGSELPTSAALGVAPTDWACTRDNVTELIWEVKSTIGLRSTQFYYLWYNSNSSINGGGVGIASGPLGTTCYQAGRCDTEKFVQDVNAVGLCGAFDWRMPTIKELQSIVDLGRGDDPAIDPDFFPNTYSRGQMEFWSGSAVDKSSAWYINFGDGYLNFLTKNRGHRVRLVRSTH